MTDPANENGAPPRDPRQPEDFDPVAQSKRLLRMIRVATLATLTETGAPFATLTAIATDSDGAPILLLSRLARHTRNLERDPRCSLLLARSGRGDPLAHPRLTLTGEAARDPEPRLKARFLRRNPKAALYVDFPDFCFWRLSIENVHINGGFARAADFAPGALLADISGAEPLLAAEEDILAHLNADHADMLALLAGDAEKAGAERNGKWRATGVDPEGLDLSSGDRLARAAFLTPAKTPDGARAQLIALAKAAQN